jgi:hypothetical protein
MERVSARQDGTGQRQLQKVAIYTIEPQLHFRRMMQLSPLLSQAL